MRSILLVLALWLGFLALKLIGSSGPNGFVLVDEESLHSTVAIRNGSLVNRVFDSGFATIPPGGSASRIIFWRRRNDSFLCEQRHHKSRA